MSSFKPYQKPPFFTAEFPVKQKSEIGIESKTSKINYMERTLENGNVVKIQVVNENAVRTLLANGFKKSYPAPEEETAIETDPENTQHVICRPSPILPCFKNFTPFTLASFLQPGLEEILQYQAEKRSGCIKSTHSPTSEEMYIAAVKDNPYPQIKSKKQKALRGRFPRASQKSVLEQIMVDAEKNASEREEMVRASTVIRYRHSST
ncbi:uncharacterized protein CELE_F19H6.5 [Caenorhabditis elegans]|uniref:Uncharacterized protein n=1 Tax=Caenorhabditis elegans TaxID=6239 RepID=Q19602_CAEEL|nr:Uncharacterized protein CELE_F19H6.5 [Caenorhabditis elegans]CAA92165.2 Uncharacterized protein CELE_F19H6.5 [Caenorhabditis elegans]|eukprot:NP_510076.2 Uncharacterized protein CELE_F19H6.5 [Caenorhabditis elegans]